MRVAGKRDLTEEFTALDDMPPVAPLRIHWT